MHPGGGGTERLPHLVGRRRALEIILGAIERFSLTSSKPFDQIVSAVNALIGHPDMAEFGRSTRQATTFTELKEAVEEGLSEVGLMLFMQLDHGAVLQKETRRNTPKIIRLIVSNPLIMKEMA